MRKALVVGINNYPTAPLAACVNDASAFAAIIETNGNGDPNFDVRLCNNIPKRSHLLEQLQILFQGECEVALFYFAGHGYESELGTYLVTPDAAKLDVGVSMTDLLVMANASKAKNRIIILDCCHAGAAGTSKAFGSSNSSLNNGVTILAASKSDEKAVELNGQGLFTSLLIDGLQGGAADLQGEITPGSVYAYIDKALGAFEQRPVFKTNISEFISLRTIAPKISKETIRKIVNFFPTAGQEFALNPSYEETNSPTVEHLLIEPYACNENVAVFKELQALQSAGLVVPVNAPYMYYAAMHSKSCRLTALGYHYWRLVKRKKI